MILRNHLARWLTAALLGVLLASCAAPLACGPDEDSLDLGLRTIPSSILVPATIDLTDRGVETVAVLAWDAPGGAELARDLATELGEAGIFRVVDPAASVARLNRAGVSVDWEASRAALLAAAERGGFDALVIGRVERFQLEGHDKTDETFAVQGTGTYSFVVNDEGKIAHREKMESARVPLLCRTDRGSVAASYRVWDARSGVEVATVRHELSAEVPSFCYRGDVPEGVKHAAQDRLLQRLFRELNKQFLAQVVPSRDEARIEFEVLWDAEPAARTANELALVFARQGEWKRAVEVWEDFLKVGPEFPSMHYNLARAYQALGRRTLAIEHLERALVLEPRPLYRRTLTALRPPTLPGR